MPDNLHAGDIRLLSKEDLRLRVRELLTAEAGYCARIDSLFAAAESATADRNRFATALCALARPVPSTKGLGPADRAQRLHAELERRIAAAKEAING